jgi:hypothetical protein
MNRSSFDPAWQCCHKDESVESLAQPLANEDINFESSFVPDDPLIAKACGTSVFGDVTERNSNCSKENPAISESLVFWSKRVSYTPCRSTQRLKPALLP